MISLTPKFPPTILPQTALSAQCPNNASPPPAIHQVIYGVICIFCANITPIPDPTPADTKPFYYRLNYDCPRCLHPYPPCTPSRKLELFRQCWCCGFEYPEKLAVARKSLRCPDEECRYPDDGTVARSWRKIGCWKKDEYDAKGKIDEVLGIVDLEDVLRGWEICNRRIEMEREVGLRKCGICGKCGKGEKGAEDCEKTHWMWGI